MYAYLIVGVFFLAIAIGAVLMTTSAGRRLRTAERLSTISRYGFEAAPTQAGLPADPEASPIERIMTKLGEVFSARFGSVGEAEMRAELMSAGMYTTSPTTLLGTRIVLAIVAPLVVLLILGTSSLLRVAIVVFMVFGGWSLPLVYVQRRARERLDTIDRKLPDLIDLLTVMIEAGLGFGGALRLASEQNEGPLSDELRLMLQEQTMGLGVEEALANMAERCDTPAMRSFVRAMAQGERMGISTGQIMRNLAHEMRARRRAQAEEKAQRAPIKMLFPLVFLIFPSIFIILVTPAAIQLVKTLKF